MLRGTCSHDSDKMLHVMKKKAYPVESIVLFENKLLTLLMHLLTVHGPQY